MEAYPGQGRSHTTVLVLVLAAGIVKCDDWAHRGTADRSRDSALSGRTTEVRDMSVHVHQVETSGRVE